MKKKDLERMRLREEKIRAAEEWRMNGWWLFELKLLSNWALTQLGIIEVSIKMAAAERDEAYRERQWHEFGRRCHQEAPSVMEIPVRDGGRPMRFGAVPRFRPRRRR